MPPQCPPCVYDGHTNADNKPVRLETCSSQATARRTRARCKRPLPSSAPPYPGENAYSALLARTGRTAAARRALGMTQRCNERCTHCYLPVRPPRHPSGELTSRVPGCTGATGRPGALYLTYSGRRSAGAAGFFSLWPKQPARSAFALRIFSNGLAITPASADRIAALHRWRRRSASDAGAATHDARSRRPGSWRRTLVGSACCARAAFPW